MNKEKAEKYAKEIEKIIAYDPLKYKTYCRFCETDQKIMQSMAFDPETKIYDGFCGHCGTTLQRELTDEEIAADDDLPPTREELDERRKTYKPEERDERAWVEQQIKHLNKSIDYLRTFSDRRIKQLENEIKKLDGEPFEEVEDTSITGLMLAFAQLSDWWIYAIADHPMLKKFNLEKYANEAWTLIHHLFQLLAIEERFESGKETNEKIRPRAEFADAAKKLQDKRDWEFIQTDEALENPYEIMKDLVKRNSRQIYLYLKELCRRIDELSAEQIQSILFVTLNKDNVDRAVRRRFLSLALERLGGESKAS